MLLISKVKIDRQGYESPSGKYYGVGLPVYRASDRDSGDIVYEGRHATRAGAVAPAKAAYARWQGKGQRNPHRKGPLRRTLGSRPKQKVKNKVVLYYSVIVPWEPDYRKRTKWHPSDRHFGPLSRGYFKTTALAHAWAAKNLGPGAEYSVRRFRGV